MNAARNRPIVALLALAVLAWNGCGDSGNDPMDAAVTDPGTDTPTDPGTDTPTDPGRDAAVTDAGTDAVDDAGTDAAADVPGPDPWVTNFAPRRETRGDITVLWLKGTPYEMGKQHGALMAAELAEGVAFLGSSELGLLQNLFTYYGFDEDARQQSYDMIREECEGMADGAQVEGWTADVCLGLAYGEIVLDHFNLGLLQCSQFVAAGPAVAAEDGELIHGRNLDWDAIDYLLDHPTIIVRHPEGRIPYVSIGFPGNVATYNGINAAGISVASNENESIGDIDRVGRPSVQTQNVILAEHDNLDDIMAMMEGLDRMSAENIVVADGNAGRAAIYQLTASHFGKDELGDDGVAWITNHYTHPDMTQWGIEYETGASTLVREWRLRQLLDPAETGTTLYGTLDVPKAVSILRDRYNPLRMAESPEDAFDDNRSIATNGAIYSIVFLPKRGQFWLAAGNPPVPRNAYVGFSLAELFGWEDPVAPDPAKVD
jgi:hypothetical protein